MTHLLDQIHLVNNGTRGLTPNLAEACLEFLRSHPAGAEAEALRVGFRSLAQTLLHPTEAECIDMLDRLRSEEAELDPWVNEIWPEHRSETTLAELVAIERGIRHFEAKLSTLRLQHAA